MRQPRVEEVNSGEGDTDYVEFCQRAAVLVCYSAVSQSSLKDGTSC